MLDPWAVNHSRWKKQLASLAYEASNLHSASVLHALCDAEASAIQDYGLTNDIVTIANGVTLPAPRNVRQFGRQFFENHALSRQASRQEGAI